MSPDRDESSAWELEASRSLIASVEELRALLARLSERDRDRVIAYAKELMQAYEGGGKA